MNGKWTLKILGAPLLAVLLALASTTGCSEDSSSETMDDIIGEEDLRGDEDVEMPDDVDAPLLASVRAIHLSPDAPAVDIFANEGDEAVVSGLAFLAGSDYLDVPEGTYSFDIAPAGMAWSDSVLRVDLELSGETHYTAAAYGTLENGLQALALVDDYSELADDLIRVRAIHAAPAVGEVDIWNVPADGEPSPLYENVGFGVAGDYLEIPAGVYTLGFDVDDDASPDVIFDLPELAAGTIANVFAVNDSDGNVFLQAQFADGSLATINPTVVPEIASVRVLHLSPDAPAVDVFVNSGMTPAITELAFGESTDYVELDADLYTFNVAVSGSSAMDAVLNPELELMAGVSYTAVAYDTLGNGLKAMALVDDYAELAADHIRVRAIHAASIVGEVDIWNIPSQGDPSILWENVPFGVVGQYYDLPVGTYTIGIDADDDEIPDLIFEIPELPGGTVANVFATHDADDNIFLHAQLNDGSTVTLLPEN